jgi:peptide/nickel transport system substrate-binding protein
MLLKVSGISRDTARSTTARHKATGREVAMRKSVYGIVAIALGAVAGMTPGVASAKDTLTLGMALEPRGLDPTTKAEAAISQIALYNIYEGLTRISEKGEVGPGLATSWTADSDRKVFTFKLRSGVMFSDGTTFDSADVKYTYERNAGEKSTNKRKKRFINMASIETPDSTTVKITLKDSNPKLAFQLGESTAVIVAPETAAKNETNPVGTGPFKMSKWVRGDSVTLVKNEHYRDPASIKLSKVTFKFMSDPTAQMAALRAGDIDLFPYFSSYESVPQFQKDKDFNVLVGTTEGEMVLSTNNKSPKMADVRVRRAVAYAINRQEIIDGALSGFGTPIGSHMAPHNPAYVDLTGAYAHNPAKAKALLAEAGHANGLTVSLKLPPPAYARRGGEIIAAQLAKVGITAKIEPVEWAQWLDQVYKKKNYDLSIVMHVEPNDINIYANPKYYFQYDNQEFRDIIKKAETTLDPAERKAALQAAQRKLSEDAVNGFLVQGTKISVMRKGVTGVWANSPMFVNDLAAIAWK